MSELTQFPEYTSLTRDAIRQAVSDDELFDLLSGEISHRMRFVGETFEEHVAGLRALPIGLRAMAATHKLDVSMALDSLSDHFANYHDLPFAEETLLGLRELGAVDVADVFDKALSIARENWQELGAGCPENGSEWDDKFGDLSGRLWELLEPLPDGILTLWPIYARRHPERVCDS